MSLSDRLRNALGMVLAAHHNSVTLLHNPGCFQVKAGGRAALPAHEHTLWRENGCYPLEPLKSQTIREKREGQRHLFETDLGRTEN